MLTHTHTQFTYKYNILIKFQPEKQKKKKNNEGFLTKGKSEKRVDRDNNNYLTYVLLINWWTSKHKTQFINKQTKQLNKNIRTCNRIANGYNFELTTKEGERTDFIAIHLKEFCLEVLTFDWFANAAMFLFCFLSINSYDIQQFW